MNKHLLTLAGLLSLLAVNQAFGWVLNIKNNTVNTYPSVSVKTSCGGYHRKLIPHELDTIDVGECDLNYVQIGSWKNEIAGYVPRKDTNFKALNPLKGLTIHAANGKTVIHENLGTDETLEQNRKRTFKNLLPSLDDAINTLKR